MKIYLLRHGAIELPRAQAMVGQIDLPLSAKGIKQAERWREVFTPGCFDLMYCSDLTRSIHTAEIISQGRIDRIEVVPSLREIDLGAWEGLSRNVIQKQFPVEWAKRQENVTGHRPPGGESFVDLKERIVPVFDHIASSSGDNVLIVGHAGVNRVILSAVLGMPLTNIFRLKVDYGSLSTIDVVKNEKRIITMNAILSREGDEYVPWFQKHSDSGSPDDRFYSAGVSG